MLESLESMGSLMGVLLAYCSVVIVWHRAHHGTEVQRVPMIVVKPLQHSNSNSNAAIVVVDGVYSGCGELLTMMMMMMMAGEEDGTARTTNM